jgi:prolipoprotein diacylglyceryltransferase
MYFLALPLANLLIKKKYHQESGFARHSVFWFVFAMFVIGFLGFRIPFWICSMVE